MNSAAFRKTSLLVTSSLIVVACSAGNPQGHSGKAGASGSDGSSGTKDAGQDASTASSDSEAATDAHTGTDADASDTDADASAADLTCGVQTSEAHVAKTSRPVDIIFVIDNSGSMSDEIKAVEDNINDSFAHIIAESGADYRVIMLTSHGDSSIELVCIRAPLSNTSCNPIPALPANSDRFFHYDFNVQSWDSLCRVLETFDMPDVHAFTTMGWQEWLREDALKVFVEISDDGLGCSTARGDFEMLGSDPITAAVNDASAFDAALLTLSPAQFGTKTARKYVWHSIIGLKANTPAKAAYSPKAPVQTAICPSAASAGEGYQMLSIITGGLRYPVCDGTGFDAVFGAIAGEVVKGSGVECRFSVPDAPPGKYVDLQTIAIDYTSGTGKKEALQLVDAEKCSATGFVVDGGDVKLCAAACTRVRTDDAAKLSVRFECGQKPPDAPQ